MPFIDAIVCIAAHLRRISAIINAKKLIIDGLITIFDGIIALGDGKQGGKGGDN
jgi:hypothetical protein